MRGDTLHNFIATGTEMTAGRFFASVGTEYQFTRSGVTTYFDVFAWQGCIALGLEVETTLRHAIDNAKKAATVDVPLWVIVPTRKLKLELIRRLESLELRPGGEPVNVLLLGQLERMLVNYLSKRMANSNENTSDITGEQNQS
ncbi:hypothetical protein ACFL3G_02655 [Planctomycetota bacterium]